MLTPTVSQISAVTAHPLKPGGPLSGAPRPSGTARPVAR